MLYKLVLGFACVDEILVSFKCSTEEVEQYFSVLLRKVVLMFALWTKSCSMTFKMLAMESYFYTGFVCFSIFCKLFI